MEKDLLILNNKNLNLSEHDQNLSIDALKGIISAKKSYETAKKENNKEGMAKANAYANAIRKQYGGYTGGDDGSAYYPMATATKKEKPSYSSPYTDKIDDLYNKISNREEFSYNPDTDPMYILYKKVYEQFGDTASKRAYTQGTFKTGGLDNSNAVSAAAQAENFYKTQLAEKTMDLYKSAYSKYIAEGQDMMKNLEYLSGAEEKAYNRYRDALKDYNYENEVDYEKMRDIEKEIKDDVRYAGEIAYKKERDAASDRLVKDEMTFNKQKEANENARWMAQNEIDRYNALAKLIQSIYGKSTIGVDVNAIRHLLGI